MTIPFDGLDPLPPSIRKSYQAPEGPGLFATLGMIGFCIVAAVVWSFIAPTVISILTGVGNLARLWVPGALLQFAMLSAILGIGVLLYQLKARRLIQYAYFEITAGALGAMYAANQIFGDKPSDTLTKGGLATLGAIYIIVRGLDNRAKAQQERRELQPKLP